MKLNYQLTEDDYLAFQLYTSSHSPLHKKRRFRSKIIVPVAYLGFGLYSYLTKDSFSTLIIFATLALAWFLAYPYYMRWAYKRHFKRNIAENYGNRVYSDIQVEFLPDSITSQDKSGSSAIKTDQLTELVETAEHYFVKLITGESFIIPKTAVEDAQRFKETILAYGPSYTDANDWKW